MTSKRLISVDQKFNRSGMVKTMDRTKSKVHQKAGELVVSTAKSLIQSSVNTSQPGQPPKGKTDRLRGSILYAVEGGSQPSVLVGAKILNSTNQSVRSSSPASEILEHGGKIEVHEVKRSGGKWQRVGIASMPLTLSPAVETRWRRVAVKKRPFMLPALRAVQNKLPSLWRGMFKKG